MHILFVLFVMPVTVVHRRNAMVTYTVTATQTCSTTGPAAFTKVALPMAWQNRRPSVPQQYASTASATGQCRKWNTSSSTGTQVWQHIFTCQARTRPNTCWSVVSLIAIQWTSHSSLSDQLRYASATALAATTPT